jgi:hypothetical protein
MNRLRIRQGESLDVFVKRCTQKTDVPRILASRRERRRFLGHPHQMIHQTWGEGFTAYMQEAVSSNRFAFGLNGTRVQTGEAMCRNSVARSRKFQCIPEMMHKQRLG